MFDMNPPDYTLKRLQRIVASEIPVAQSRIGEDVLSFIHFSGIRPREDFQLANLHPMGGDAHFVPVSQVDLYGLELELMGYKDAAKILNDAVKNLDEVIKKAGENHAQYYTEPGITIRFNGVPDGEEKRKIESRMADAIVESMHGTAFLRTLGYTG
jgi:hypothetical protein